MVQVIDSEVEITITGTLYDLPKEEMIIMPADKPHTLKATQKLKMLLTMIRSKTHDVIKILGVLPF